MKGKKSGDGRNQEKWKKATGYVLGGVSPLGQKKRLLTLLDRSASQFSSIFVSAGRRGLELELSPDDLIGLINAQLADISVAKQK